MSGRHPESRPVSAGGTSFSGSAAATLALSTAGPLLAACGGSDSSESTSAPVLARPDDPVTWPVFDDNPPIASGLEPEAGPLKIHNWNGYVWPRIKKDFA